MNEVSYGQQPHPLTDDPARALSASQVTGGAATQELAQLILMGMQRDIESQIDWRVQQQGVTGRKTVSAQETGLILGSIGIGVPLTAIAGAAAGLPGIIMVWLGLILINMAWALRR